MKKSVLRLNRMFPLSSILFIIIGSFLMITTKVPITGYIVNDNELATNLRFSLGMIIATIGIILILIERKDEESKLTIMISDKALERARKDRTVKSMTRKYLAEIDKIAESPNQRPQEQIGEFHVSPRGQKEIRVAWHYDPKGNILYIDDLLYHKSENEYVDNWATKVRQGHIKRNKYAGYEQLVGQLA